MSESFKNEKLILEIEKYLYDPSRFMGKSPFQVTDVFLDSDTGWKRTTTWGATRKSFSQPIFKLAAEDCRGWIGCARCSPHSSWNYTHDTYFHSSLRASADSGTVYFDPDVAASRSHP